MNIVLQREIEKWVTNELRSYAAENEIYPVFWEVTVFSKKELLEKIGYPPDNRGYFPILDVLSDICVHIKLIQKPKIADKLLFLVPFWKEEQPIIKEVIRLLFKTIQNNVTRSYE